MNKEQILKEFKFNGTVIDHYEISEFLIVLTRYDSLVFEYSFFPENGEYVRYEFALLKNNNTNNVVFKIYNA